MTKVWVVGTKFLHERKVSESVLNCAFITTEDIAIKQGHIFDWFMEMLMLGVGVGSDTKGKGALMINAPHESNTNTYIIPDTREGWAKSVGLLFDSYVSIDNRTLLFDYSQIRPKGEKIKGFGGIASGPEPLIKLHEQIRTFLNKNIGSPITSRTIVDIFNAIGACVISGNVRRSAEIIIGDPDDEEFINLKNYELNPDRAEFGWTSNNSLFTKLGTDYSRYTQRILDNGEPGFVWMENAQKYGRMGELMADNGIGVNPCAEQILANKEMCLLAEIYMNNHTDLYDYLRTIKFAYLYAKTISLTYEWISDPESRQIMTQNRRIGLSNTGVAQFMAQNGVDELTQWLDTGYRYTKHYDQHYSKWLGINESIRVTTSKPSGSVSLLAGSTPGIHHPHSEYYIRRVRLQNETPLLKVLQNAGFYTEPDVYSANTSVVEFPIHAGDNIRSEREISIWEQLEINALVQKYWSDNAVSVTIKIDPKKTDSKEIAHALDYYQYRLKSVSMLPETEGGAYAQMPYEAITKEKYESVLSNINFYPLVNLSEAMTPGSKMYDLYCDGQACEIKQ